MRYTKKHGFTILEVLVASIIMLVTVSGVSAAINSSLRTTRIQATTSLAQIIAEKVMAREVRNKPFSDKSDPSVCGNPDLSGTIAYQLKNGTVSGVSNTSTLWNKEFPSVNYSTDPDIISDLAKLSKNAKARVEIRPINVGTSGTPIYPDSRVKVNVVVIWKLNESTTVESKIEQSTIVTSNGVFNNTNPPLSKY